jgi:short-subunit dehydrogenase
MKTALMTGSSSGIGQAIAQHLKANGYRVIGISRTHGEIMCDLQDRQKLTQKVKTLLEHDDIDVLINCAGLGMFKPHEEIALEKIEEMIDVNLKAPIVLTNLTLRSLKKRKGHIINISSIEATRHSKFSALYTATKSGLRGFSLSLFEELRKAGVRVTTINPDMTKTPFFDTLHFEPSAKKNTHLIAEEIAEMVMYVLNAPSVITEITVRPQQIGVVKK